jgi:hypothetical protein
MIPLFAGRRKTCVLVFGSSFLHIMTLSSELARSSPGKFAENAITRNEVYALCGKVASASWIWQNRPRCGQVSWNARAIVCLVRDFIASIRHSGGRTRDSGRVPNPQRFISKTRARRTSGWLRVIADTSNERNCTCVLCVCRAFVKITLTEMARSRSILLNNVCTTMARCMIHGSY